MFKFVPGDKVKINLERFPSKRGLPSNPDKEVIIYMRAFSEMLGEVYWIKDHTEYIFFEDELYV